MKFLCKAVKSDNAEAAARELQQKYAGFPVATLIFFASSRYDRPKLASAVRDAFPGALTIGCTSHAELGEGETHRGSLTALAFSPDAMETAVAAVATDISNDSETIDKAVADLERQLGAKLIDLDYHRYFGIILFDGASPAIEGNLGRLGALTDITFVGGYASDDFSFAKIGLFLNGKAYTDSAVLLVLKPTSGFALFKTQSAESMGVTFTANKVDEETRTILELNNRPAVEAYADAIGIKPEAVDGKVFSSYPLGIMAGGEPFIRSGRRVMPGGGMQMFSSVKEGQRLNLMRTGDIVSVTANALKEKRHELGRIAAAIDFDCILRTTSLELEGREKEYSALFDGVEAAGFATFGEAYIANVNQTSVMALFGE